MAYFVTFPLNLWLMLLNIEKIHKTKLRQCFFLSDILSLGVHQNKPVSWLI